jgi:hypothetical protein
MPNSTPSPPHTAYTFASRAHTPLNKTVKLSVLYVQSMTSYVLSYFSLVYCLIFGSKLFITLLTSLIASPPKPLARPPHTSLFITRTPTTCLFVFLVVFATQIPHPLCLTNSRPGLVLVFFLVFHFIIRAIAAWTLPLSASSFLTMLFLTRLLFPFPCHSLPLLPLTSFSMTFLLSSFLRLPRTLLRRRPHRRPPRRPHQRPLCHLRRRMRPRRRPCPCIAHAAPPAYMSLPVSGLTCMLLSTGTRLFPPPHVRCSRIPTGSRL